MAAAVVRGFDGEPMSPPATRTSPSPSRVAVLYKHPSPELQPPSPPETDHWPVAGLYSSLNELLVIAMVPAVTSTSPLSSRLALWPSRAMFMLPVRAHFPVAGL